jgi:anti-anti-sigma regulatory factor
MARPDLPSGLVRGVPVIRTPETLEAGDASPLQAAVRYWAGYGYASFVVDMSRTLICDRTAFRVLLRLHQRARAEGGELRVVASGPVLARFRSVLGIVLPQFATLGDAVAETPAVAIGPVLGLTG